MTIWSRKYIYRSCGMLAAQRLKKILSCVNGGLPVRLIQDHRYTTQLTMAQTARTVGLVIIGDEILKGHILETNSQNICRKFYDLGFKVRKTVVIPDEVDAIAEEVARFAASYDCVITSGGVGPTHDDLTYKGIAKAFDLKIVRHPILVELIEKYFGADHSHPAFKMTEVPETAQILWNNKDLKVSYPIVAVKNVYILPGIPSYMERGLQCLLQVLQPLACPAPNMFSMYVTLDEVSITNTLNSAVEQFKPTVNFGSYPSVSNNYYKVHITLESFDQDKLDQARTFLHESLPPNTVISYDSRAIERATDKLYSFLEDPTSPKDIADSLAFAVQQLEECLLKRYTPDEVCISFNGGKDCTALLHVYYCVLKKWHPEWKGSLTALYIKCQNPFPEVENFVIETSERYNLHLYTEEGPIKKGLAEFLHSRPRIKAILMGNRRTDPHSHNLQPFQMTDPEWPQVMRVFPLLNWTYTEVWKFIRHFSIPYCILYDRGYTSLGSLHNTSPNPNLRYTNHKGESSYHPAYTLEDNTKERNGRH